MGKRGTDGKEKPPKRAKIVPYNANWFVANPSILREEIKEHKSKDKKLITILAAKAGLAAGTIHRYLAKPEKPFAKSTTKAIAKAWSNVRKKITNAVPELMQIPEGSVAKPKKIVQTPPTLKLPEVKIKTIARPNQTKVPQAIGVRGYPAPAPPQHPISFSFMPPEPLGNLNTPNLEGEVDQLRQEVKELKQQLYLKYPIVLENWEMPHAPARERAINEGAFGEVTTVSVPVNYAVKWYKDREKGNKLKLFKREVRQLVKCQHEYIVRMIGWGTVPQPFVVMELMDTDLEQWMKSTKPLGLSNYTEADLYHALKFPLFQLAIVSF